MIYKVDDINLPIKKRNKLLDLVFVDHNSKVLSEEEIKNAPSLLLDAYDLSAVFISPIKYKLLFVSLNSTIKILIKPITLHLIISLKLFLL